MQRVAYVGFIKVGAFRRGEVASCRETHDANPAGIYTQPAGVFPYVLNGPLGILQGAYGFVHHGPVIRQAVFEYYADYPRVGQTPGDFFAFMIYGKT
jgi:hypothetical protein